MCVIRQWKRAEDPPLLLLLLLLAPLLLLLLYPPPAGAALNTAALLDAPVLVFGSTVVTVLSCTMVVLPTILLACIPGVGTVETTRSTTGAAAVGAPSPCARLTKFGMKALLRSVGHLYLNAGSASLAVLVLLPLMVGTRDTPATEALLGSVDDAAAGVTVDVELNTVGAIGAILLLEDVDPVDKMEKLGFPFLLPDSRRIVRMLVGEMSSGTSLSVFFRPHLAAFDFPVFDQSIFIKHFPICMTFFLGDDWSASKKSICLL